MNMRYFIVIIFVLVISAGHAYPEETVTLDSLIDEALNNNPKIQAAYSEWKAAEYKARYVRGLPDPMASYGYFGESVETKVGPQEHKYGVSQTIPFPGKLGLKGKAQAKLASILEEKYEAAKREITKEIKFLYYDIYWVDKAIKITEEEKAIIEGLEKVAQRKYESNLTPQQDVIKAQVELSKLIDKLFLLRQNRKSLEAKANRFLNRPRGKELGKTSDVGSVEFTYELEELHRISDESSQQLLVSKLDIERAEYERSLARLNYLPDFTFGVDYIEIGSGSTTQPNDGDDAWMGKVAINVPIWFGKLNAQVKEKKALLESSKKNHEDAENVVDYEVEDLYFKIMTYKDIISLYKTALVPQAEQAYDAAKTSYETGKVDFLNWLDAERVLLQTRLAHYKAIVDYQKSIAYLERVIGRDL
ncbi:MAG: TolC family protein [Candidatus Omnitrophica bacterium]|nr:TolC family protein [Candidatus Omnitrophota bacterium]MBU4458252.1 TolC family protein [Candidatus Omnitrophota bacterium]